MAELANRLPVPPVPTFEVPNSSALARTVALPAPEVVSDTAPISALSCEPTSIDWPAVDAVNPEVPVTVSRPFCVSPPVAELATRLPVPPVPTFEVPSTSALARTVALPAPEVVSDTAPVSTLSCEPTLIDCPAVEAVNADVPVTVSTPFCVRLPVAELANRLPVPPVPTFEVPSTSVLARTVALPAPEVVSDTAPVSTLSCEPTLIDCPAVDAVNAEVPDTSSTSDCVIPSVSAVAMRSPVTVVAPKLTLLPLTCTVPTGSAPVAPEASRVPDTTVPLPIPTSEMVPPVVSRLTARMIPEVLTAFVNSKPASFADRVTAAPVSAPALSTALVTAPGLAFSASPTTPESTKLSPPPPSSVTVATRPAARLILPKPTLMLPVPVLPTLLPISVT